MLREGCLQVLYHLHHTLLVALGEVLRDVDLAHGLAQQSVGHAHGALPAGAHLLLARHLTAEELEVGGVDVVAKIWGGACEVVRCKICAQRLDGLRLYELVDGVERLGLADDDGVEVTYAHTFEVCRPVDGVVTLCEVGLRHGVVVGGDVTQLDVRAELLGHLGLEGDDGGSLLGGVLHAVEGECLREPCGISLA